MIFSGSRVGVVGDQHIEVTVQRRIGIFKNRLFQHVHVPLHILFSLEGADIHGDIDIHIHRHPHFLKILSLPEDGTMGIGFDAERIDAIILSLTKIESKYLRLRTENGLLFQNLGFHLTLAQHMMLQRNRKTSLQLQTQGNGLKDCIFSPFSNGKTVKERIEVSRPSLVEDQTAILPCLYQFLILPVIQEFISINCLRQQHLFDIHTLFFSISIYQFILFFSYPSIL